MTKQLNMAPGGMRIVLPGSWTRIPLEDPEQTVAFVKRFVKRQTGKADRLAKVRRETVQDLLASARDAARSPFTRAAVPPASRMALAVSSAPSCDALKWTETRIPCAPRSLAIAAPTRFPAPVTSALFPLSSTRGQR